MNDIMANDPVCSQRGLKLRTYQVIPMTPRFDNLFCSVMPFEFMELYVKQYRILCNVCVMRW